MERIRGILPKYLNFVFLLRVSKLQESIDAIERNEVYGICGIFLLRAVPQPETFFLLIITYTFEKKRKCFATENKKAVVSFGFEI